MTTKEQILDNLIYIIHNKSDTLKKQAANKNKENEKCYRKPCTEPHFLSAWTKKGFRPSESGLSVRGAENDPLLCKKCILNQLRRLEQDEGEEDQENRKPSADHQDNQDTELSDYKEDSEESSNEDEGMGIPNPFFGGEESAYTFTWYPFFYFDTSDDNLINRRWEKIKIPIWAMIDLAALDGMEHEATLKYIHEMDQKIQERLCNLNISRRELNQRTNKKKQKLDPAVVSELTEGRYSRDLSKSIIS